MKIVGKNIIGYELSEGFGLQFKTLNPRLNCENDFAIFEASDDDIHAALRKADQAKLAFASLKGSERAAFLRLIAEKLSQNKATLIEVYQLESGLPESRAVLELNRTLHQLKEFANLISIPDWDLASRTADDASPFLQKVYKALGTVVVFGASNFPFAYSTIGGDSASALAAGCPVIVKAHPMHAGTGDLVAQLVVQAAAESGMPDGVFSNLNAQGIELGQKLVLHPAVKAVGFTGSFSGGMALYRLAQERSEPIPVFAEMGSVNPIFILPNGLDFPNLPKLLADSITLNAGQFCTNPGLIFLLKSEESQQLVDQLSVLLSEGEAQVMLHPKIKENYLRRATEISCHSSTKSIVATKSAEGTSIYPQMHGIEYSDFKNDPILSEEVFGMHTLIVFCADLLEMKAAIRNLPGQLTASIVAAEEELVESPEFIHLLSEKVGRIIFNGVPTGVTVTQAMHHGGPFPATTDSRFTAVGTDAIFRFLRPLVFQNFSTKLLRDLAT